MKNPNKPVIFIACALCVIVISLVLFLSNVGPGGSTLTRDYHGITNSTEEQGSAAPPESMQEGKDINLLPGSRDLSEIGDSLQQDKYQAILLKYSAMFSKLQSEYTGKLNNLLKRAQLDIQNSGGQNKEIIKISYQYLKEARALEKECDTKFYSILSDMKKELKQEHFPQDVVDEAETQYKQQKKERERYLSTKALAYIKGN